MNLCICHEHRAACDCRPDTVKFRKVTDTGVIPQYASKGAVGLDLVADMDEVIHIGEHKLIKTGIAIALPAHLEAQVRSRSGLALKNGIMVLNSPGTIDPDYRGEIGVILYNAGHMPYHVVAGSRIAQLVIAPFVRAHVIEVSELDETERGVGGFGSTGVR